MTKKNAIFLILCCVYYSLPAWSQDSLKRIIKGYNITGTICDDTNTPIEGVNVCIYTFKEDKIVETSHTSPKGIFIIKNIEAGKYKLKCSHVGYSDYTAELIVSKGQNLSLGTLIMYTENIKLNEVTLTANRNIFTTEKQSIYPSQQQIETSGGGMDLLQKLPIPLLDVNPINRTVSSLDTFGGVALLINDIPADANDIAIIDPKHIKRVDVIRKPGMEYGSNLAIAINIVLKEVVDGIILDRKSVV